MADYTIQVQRTDDDGDSWTPIKDADTVEDVDDIHRALEDIAAGQWPMVLPAKAGWRVAAWVGADADTSTDPDLTTEAWTGDDPEAVADELPDELVPERLLAELDQIRRMREALDERRDLVIRVLMKTDTRVPRARIATAAGVKEARLYQIRDGRR